ncbi:MAG: TetR/AcrR family transcriptional regulator, fatty acid metabolism regulator protein [Gaiellaceae bacterium]|nr:TetR/AcrR family transcriptional regulator, fatty acid metabolism regulator protein [Gaiellaceae bacterium]
MATDTQREKRRLILRAAISVFAHHGYHTSRVADVAREAGVAYGLVYHYFQSKEDLLETIFRRTWSRMLEAVQEVEQEGAPAREQLASVARIVLGAWEADPDLVRVLVREIARSPQLGNEVDEVQHAFAALERIVARGQERGELRTDVDPRLAAWILYGALEEILTGWVFDRLPAGPDDVARAEQTVVSVLTDGLAVD